MYHGDAMMAFGGKLKCNSYFPSNVVLIGSSFFFNLPCGALAAASTIFLFKVPDTIKPADATLKENFCEWIYRDLFSSLRPSSATF